MQRTTALVVLLCLAPAAVHADELSSRPPGEMRKHELYEEYWHLWWDKPGYAGPIWWSIVGAGGVIGGAAGAVSLATGPSEYARNGTIALPVLGLAVGALVLTLAIYWGTRRSAERDKYDERMNAITDELALRNLPPPGSGDP
jgi:hypothetical protein